MWPPLFLWQRIATLDEVSRARARLWRPVASSAARPTEASVLGPTVSAPGGPARTGLRYLARPGVAPAPGGALSLAKYLSREWVEKGRAHVEADPRFKAHTAGLHASILCVVHEQPTHADEVFFIEFDDGHIREIYSGPLSEFQQRKVETTFEVHGNYGTFVQIQEGHLTQATALMRGRLRLKGSVFRALKYMRALEAVTDILREVPTEY